MMYHFKNEKTDEPSVFSILKIVYKSQIAIVLLKKVFFQRVLYYYLGEKLIQKIL